MTALLYRSRSVQSLHRPSWPPDAPYLRSLRTSDSSIPFPGREILALPQPISTAKHAARIRPLPPLPSRTKPFTGAFPPFRLPIPHPPGPPPPRSLQFSTKRRFLLLFPRNATSSIVSYKMNRVSSPASPVSLPREGSTSTVLSSATQKSKISRA